MDIFYIWPFWAINDVAAEEEYDERGLGAIGGSGSIFNLASILYLRGAPSENIEHIHGGTVD